MFLSFFKKEKVTRVSSQELLSNGAEQGFAWFDVSALDGKRIWHGGIEVLRANSQTFSSSCVFLPPRQARILRDPRSTHQPSARSLRWGSQCIHGGWAVTNPGADKVNTVLFEQGYLDRATNEPSRYQE